jgi:hypothetical protein
MFLNTPCIGISLLLWRSRLTGVVRLSSVNHLTSHVTFGGVGKGQPPALFNQAVTALHATAA